MNKRELFELETLSNLTLKELQEEHPDLYTQLQVPVASKTGIKPGTKPPAKPQSPSDIPIKDNPLFHDHLQQAKLYHLGEISGLSDSGVASILANGQTAATLTDQVLQDMVSGKKLKDRQARNLGLTVTLYNLFDENLELTRTIKQGTLTQPGGRKFEKLRDLAVLDAPDWLNLLQEANITPPDNTTLESFAKTLSQKMEVLFPTDAFLGRLTPVNAVDLVKEIKQAAPLFEGNDSVFNLPGMAQVNPSQVESPEIEGLHKVFRSILRLDNLEMDENEQPSLQLDGQLASLLQDGNLTGLTWSFPGILPTSKASIFSCLDPQKMEPSEIEAIQASYMQIKKWVNLYPGLGLGQILDDPNLSPENKAANFTKKLGWIKHVWQKNPDSEILKLNYSSNSADTTNLNLKGLPKTAQGMVVSTLKAYQRTYALTKNVGHARAILQAGYTSAVEVVNGGYDAFLQTTGLSAEDGRACFDAARTMTITIGARLGAILDHVRGGFNWLKVSNHNGGAQHLTRTGTPVQVDRLELKHLDDFESLFGNQTFCQCLDCQSILSPAAYFVDLMYFLETNLGQAFQQLSTRRRDLWTVELTCDNTNTEIPTLEIVNNILEGYIAQNIILPLVSFILELTDASFQALENQGIPSTVLNPLSDIKNKIYPNAQNFIVDIKTRLSPQDFLKYYRLILRYALYLKYFILTDDSFQKLQNNNVPTTVIDELQPLKNEKYYLKDVFGLRIEELLGAQTTKYIKLIMENAAVLVLAFDSWYFSSAPDLLETVVFQGINEISQVFGSFKRPFELPIEKLQSYLALSGLKRSDIARRMDADPTMLAMTVLNLSQQEYLLITKKNTDLFYILSMFAGIQSSFIKGTHSFSALDVQDILKPMGLSRSDLGELIKTRFVSGGLQIVAGKRSPDSVQNDIEKIKNLTFDILDRMHRFTRLWRKLPALADAPDGPRWTMAELDLILDLMGCNSLPERTIDCEDLVTVLSLQDRWGTSLMGACGLWAEELTDIRFSGQKVSTSFLDQLFNLPIFGQTDNPFPRDNSKFVHPAFQPAATADSANDALHRLHAGLQVNDDQLYQLIVHLAKALGMDLPAAAPDYGFYLSSHNLTLLYRHARLAKLLKLTIPALFQLIEFALASGWIDHAHGSGASLQNLADITTLLAFYDWWQANHYTLDDLGFISRGTISKPESYPDSQDITPKLVTKVQTDKALEFADTVFALLNGVTEAQSRLIVAANSDSSVKFIEAVNPEKTIYHLTSAFSSSTTLVIPSEVAAAVTDPNLATNARAVLLKYHASQVIPISLAALVNLPVDKTSCLISMTGADLFDPDFTRILQGLTTTKDLLTPLIDQVVRLNILFTDQVFDPATLDFVGKHPHIFSINQLTRVTQAQVRSLSVYSTAANGVGEDRLSSIGIETSDLLSALASQPVAALDQQQMQELADILHVEVGLASTLLNNIPLPKDAPESLQILMHCADLVSSLGVGSETPALILSDDPDKLSLACSAILGALRAKHPDDQDWQSLVTPIENKLLSRKRDTLCDFLIQLSKLGAFGLHVFNTLHDLYQYFLMDVDLEGCARTSQVVAAISSVQLYVQRILMGLESVDLSSDQPAQAAQMAQLAKEWEWRKNYRVWEANRKVFLYPENYLEPDLRDDKTPLFQEMESTLLQQETTTQGVLDAYTTYLNGFEAVARLKIAGSYHDIVAGRDTLHLFGITTDTPPIYYYRAVNNAYWAENLDSDQKNKCAIDWSYWQKVDVQIPVSKVSPVVYNGRLYVFWVEFTTTPKNDLAGGESMFVGYKHKMTLKYTSLRLDGTWTAPQTIALKDAIFSDLVTGGTERSVFPTGEGIIDDPLYNPGINRALEVIVKSIADQITIISTTDSNDPGFAILLTGLKNTKYDLLREIGKNSIPKYDVIPHIVDFWSFFDKKENESWTDYGNRLSKIKAEPKDGYTLSGFHWAQVYPVITDEGLVVTGRDFLIRGVVDFYKKAIVPSLQYRRYFIDWLLYYIRPSADGSIPAGLQYIHSPSPDWLLDDFAWSSIIVNEEQKLKQQDDLIPIGEANDLASVAGFSSFVDYFRGKNSGKWQTYDFRQIIAGLNSLPDINVVNGTGFDQTIKGGNPYYQDYLLDFAGDSFLLQRTGSNNEYPNFLLKRLGTGLIEGMIRTLFMNGVDALLGIENQKGLHETPVPYPDDQLNPQINIDDVTNQNFALAEHFNFMAGPYGVYYREIFFHIPFLIANHLNSQGHFADAQRWYHYIFDPTATENTTPPQDRNWRFLEFRKQIPSLREILTGPTAAEAIEAYKKYPFNPDAIARLRPSAYQKAIVMKYVDNLLDWADRLFSQYTMESVNEATMLYVMAADILGDRPAELGECGEGRLKPKNFKAIEPYLHEGEFLQEVPAEMETSVICSANIGLDKLKLKPNYIFDWANLTSKMRIMDLSSPKGKADGIFKAFSWKQSPASFDNKKLGVKNSPLIQDPTLIPDFNLSMIRSSCCFYGDRTKGGEDIPLSPIFCIPANSELLGFWDRVEDRLHKIRHCLDINGVARNLALFAPEINPRLLIQMEAAGLTLEDVFGTTSGNLPPYRFAFLIEKAKQFTSAIQGFGSALLSALEKKDIERLNNLRSVHERNILELTRQSKQWEIGVESQSLLALQQQQEAVIYRRGYYQGLIEEGLSSWEKTEQVARDATSSLRISAATMDTLAAIFYLVPQLGSPFSMKYGGLELGNSGKTWSEVFRTMAEISEAISASAGLEATFERRAQEWKHQVELANRELKQIDRQIAAATIRQQIATQSLVIHDKSIQQAEEIYEYYANKFSNFGLYSWLSTTLQMLYRDAYNSAFSMAQLTEQAYRFERSDDTTILLDSGYWDASHAGLLAGERLLIALQNMERKYIETNYRTFEIDQSFSLAQIAPSVLIQLRETGSCDFTIPEIFFDLVYPGQYQRIIKAVRISIPCVTGPYTNVGATLRLKESGVRTEANPGVSAWKNVPLQRSVSIATSKAQNDAGVFELNFHDERYMPFEGAGAAGSSWHLELPKTMRAFDYDTISDVILHISYTSKDGANVVINNNTFKDIVEGGAVQKLNGNLFRLVSLKHEFPTSYYQMLHPTGSNQAMTFELGYQNFPFFLSGTSLTLTQMDLFLKPEDQKSIKTTGLQLSIDISGQNVGTIAGKDLVSDPLIHGSISSISIDPFGIWKVNVDAGSLDPSLLDDILILITYNC